MHTETTPSTAAGADIEGKSLAQYLLTAERVLMGVVLVACGVSGLFNLLTHASNASAAMQASGGSLIKAGFMFPLLKGAETLLQVWVNKERP